MFLNGGRPHRWIGKKKKNTNLTGGVWLASQDLARLLDPTSRPYLPSVINSLSTCLLMCWTCNCPIED